MSAESSKKLPWKKIAAWTLRLAIFTLVVWGIAKTIGDAQAKFAAKDFSLAHLSWPWIALSCLLYTAANLPSAWFWRETLVAMGQRPPFWQTVRAYFVGHLGKYVPGKALVVVIRAAMIKGERVDATVAALGVFVETLTLMAVGAVLSAAILPWISSSDVEQHRWLIVVSVGLGVCAGVPTLPPIFRAVVRRLPYVKSHPAVEPAIRGLKLGLMAKGWGALTVGWILMGLALYAVLRAMPSVTESPVELSSLPLLIACVALATVAGFMSMIPAGAGVRELVVTVLLTPAFGEVAAIVSALVLRLVSLVSDVGVSTILYAWGQGAGIRGQ